MDTHKGQRSKQLHSSQETRGSSYLPSRGGTSTVLPVAGQDLSTLVDQCLSHCLGRVVENATESCTAHKQRV